MCEENRDENSNRFVLVFIILLKDRDENEKLKSAVRKYGITRYYCEPCEKYEITSGLL